MALTGCADGPALAAPDDVVERMERLGGSLDVDVLPLLAERAALVGLARRGSTSCGGAARLLRTGDGWIVVSLPRDDDVGLVPAWLGLAADSVDVWAEVTATVGSMGVDEVVSRAVLLGLAVAGVPAPQAPRPVDRFHGLPLRATSLGDAPPLDRPPLVVDLSALWAGPLCARLLGDRGSRIVKVESTRRPDGARQGPGAVFDLLHAGHESVALDLAETGDLRRLHELVLRADVVIEASRPRALVQMGIDARRALAVGPRVWVSITGHGREGADAERIAFGDDAAAAGGLVAWEGDVPLFVADAVADPLAGVTAAAGVVAALASGGRWLLDVAMVSVAAHVAGAGRPAWAPGPPREAVAPTPPLPRGRAGPMGADTDAVLAELGIG